MNDRPVYWNNTNSTYVENSIFLNDATCKRGLLPKALLCNIVAYLNSPYIFEFRLEAKIKQD